MMSETRRGRRRCSSQLQLVRLLCRAAAATPPSRALACSGTPVTRTRFHACYLHIVSSRRRSQCAGTSPKSTCVRRCASHLCSSAEVLQDKRGLTMAHVAAKRGHATVLDLLRSRGLVHDPMDSSVRYLFLPLHFVAVVPTVIVWRRVVPRSYWRVGMVTLSARSCC